MITFLPVHRGNPPLTRDQIAAFFAARRLTASAVQPVVGVASREARDERRAAECRAMGWTEHREITEQRIRERTNRMQHKITKRFARMGSRGYVVLPAGAKVELVGVDAAPVVTIGGEP